MHCSHTTPCTSFGFAKSVNTKTKKRYPHYSLYPPPTLWGGGGGGLGGAANAFLGAFLTLLFLILLFRCLTLLLLFSASGSHSCAVCFVVVGVAGALLLIAATAIIFLSIQMRVVNKRYEKERLDDTIGEVTEEINYYLVNGDTPEERAWLDGPNWKGPPGPLPPWKRPNCKN